MAGEEIKSVPLDPKKPPTLKQLGGFPYVGVDQATKDGFIAFAMWLGGAELAVMLGVAGVNFVTGRMETLPGAVDLLWEASIAGAVVGFFPAAIAGVLVGSRRKWPGAWSLVWLSLVVTLVTAATLSVLLGRQLYP